MVVGDSSLVILLAEDDEGHATLVRRNLKRAGVSNEIVHVKDGQEALDYLESHRGNLVMLLDINMPRVDGIEVLRRLNEKGCTQRIPIIMLTTTDNPQEVERCYELGCSVYITKPVEYEKFSDAMRQLGLFLQWVQVPPNGGCGAGG